MYNACITTCSAFTLPSFAFMHDSKRFNSVPGRDMGRTDLWHTVDFLLYHTYL